MSLRYPLPIREAARVLGLGPNKLFRALRRRKVLDQHNMPYRRYVERGLFTTDLRGYNHQHTGTQLYAVTHVTQRGMAWLAREFDLQITEAQPHRATQTTNNEAARS